MLFSTVRPVHLSPFVAHMARCEQGSKFPETVKQVNPRPYIGRPETQFHCRFPAIYKISRRVS